MGEEEKKPEEKKMEEKKADEGKQEKKQESKADKVSDGKKEEKNAEESKEVAPPPPPQEIVLRVYMHCEGCAKKVRRCLKGFDGVEDVRTDCRTHKVVVKGEKADPVKVLERVQKKSHRQVELLSPIPTPAAATAAKDAKKTEGKDVAKTEEKKEEPQVITVILKVHMHCEACAQEIKRRILRMKGVENVEPDLKSSQVTVKGAFDPPNLVDYVYKRTGKQALIVKQELEKKEEEKQEPEKKADDGGDKGGKSVEEAAEEKKAGEVEATAAAAEGGGGGGEGEGEEMGKVVELKKSEFYYNYPQNNQIYSYPPTFESYGNYPPQMFSDENPNACSIM